MDNQPLRLSCHGLPKLCRRLKKEGPIHPTTVLIALAIERMDGLMTLGLTKLSNRLFPTLIVVGGGVRWQFHGRPGSFASPAPPTMPCSSSKPIRMANHGSEESTQRTLVLS